MLDFKNQDNFDFFWFDSLSDKNIVDLFLWKNLNLSLISSYNNLNRNFFLSDSVSINLNYFISYINNFFLKKEVYSLFKKKKNNNKFFMKNLFQKELNNHFEPFYKFLNLEYFLDFQFNLNKKILNFYINIFDEKKLPKKQVLGFDWFLNYLKLDRLEMVIFRNFSSLNNFENNSFLNDKLKFFMFKNDICCFDTNLYLNMHQAKNSNIVFNNSFWFTSFFLENINNNINFFYKKNYNERINSNYLFDIDLLNLNIVDFNLIVKILVIFLKKVLNYEDNNNLKLVDGGDSTSAVILKLFLSYFTDIKLVFILNFFSNVKKNRTNCNNDDLILLLLIKQKYLSEMKLKNYNKAYQWYLRERLFVDFINKRENSLLKEINSIFKNGGTFLDIFWFLLEKERIFNQVTNQEFYKNKVILKNDLLSLYTNPFISNRYLLFYILENSLETLDNFDNSLVTSSFILPLFREYSFANDVFLFKNIFESKVDFSSIFLFLRYLRFNLKNYHNFVDILILYFLKKEKYLTIFNDNFSLFKDSKIFLKSKEEEALGSVNFLNSHKILEKKIYMTNHVKFFLRLRNRGLLEKTLLGFDSSSSVFNFEKNNMSFDELFFYSNILKKNNVNFNINSLFFFTYLKYDKLNLNLIWNNFSNYKKLKKINFLPFSDNTFNLYGSQFEKKIIDFNGQRDPNWELVRLKQLYNFFRSDEVTSRYVLKKREYGFWFWKLYWRSFNHTKEHRYKFWKSFDFFFNNQEYQIKRLFFKDKLLADIRKIFGFKMFQRIHSKQFSSNLFSFDNINDKDKDFLKNRVVRRWWKFLGDFNWWASDGYELVEEFYRQRLVNVTESLHNGFQVSFNRFIEKFNFFSIFTQDFNFGFKLFYYSFRFTRWLIDIGFYDILEWLLRFFS